MIDPSVFSHPAVGSFSMYLDRWNSLYLLGVGVVTPMISLYSYPYLDHHLDSMKEEGRDVSSLYKYYFLYTIFAASMMGFLLTTNLLMQFIYIILTGFSSFLIIWHFGYGSRRATATTYLVWSVIGTALFLMGIIAFGYHVGTFDIINPITTDWNEGLGSDLTVIIPLLLFFAIWVKQSLFGFHVWLPHSDDCAPTPLSAVISPNFVGISSYVLVRVLGQIFPIHFSMFFPLFLVLGFITMVYGGLTALAQDDLQRLLAYSTISQMGWIVFGIGTMTSAGMKGGVLLFVTQSLSSSVLFMVSGLLIIRYDGLQDISEMGELLTIDPILSSFVIMGFLTLVGAPLTVGFWAKTFIFSEAIKNQLITGPVTFIIIIVFVVFAGGITASYSFLTIKRMLFGWFKGDSEPKPLKWNRTTYSIAFIGLVSIILFFFPTPLLGPAKPPRLSVLTIEGLIFLTSYLGAYTIFSGKARYYVVLLSYKIENGILDYFLYEKMFSWIENSKKKIRLVDEDSFSSSVYWLTLSITIFILCFHIFFLVLR